MATLIELHMLRSLGVNSLNRGANGEVKTVFFGDVLRSRISSQSIKAEVRKEFGKTFRTRVLISNYLIPKCEREHPEMVTEFENNARSLLNQRKDDSKKDQIMVYSVEEAESIYNFIIQMIKENKNKDDANVKKEFTEAVRQSDVNLDIAMFGRMSTDGPLYTIPSAVHMNHSISINQHHGEEDFFTAFDNLKDKSAHLNASEFTSGTIYTYVNIDPVQVYQNLMLPVNKRDLSEEEYKKISSRNKKLAAESVALVTDLFYYTLPTGKQNSMAVYPLPGMFYTKIARDIPPCTAESCFESVIRPCQNKSATTVGVERFVEYMVDSVKPDGDRTLLIDSNVKREISDEIVKKAEKNGIVLDGLLKKSELLEKIYEQSMKMFEINQKKYEIQL